MSSYPQGSTDVPQPGPSTSASIWDHPPRTAKIVLIGSASVGKTSLRNRYFRGPKGFSQAYIATIGADFVTKTIELDDNDGGGSGGPSKMSLQLWDTAGQERFQALGAAFYRGADACIIVYACNSKTSAQRIESWFSAFVERCPLTEGQERSFPFICVGNKHDLVRSSSSQDLVDEEDVLEMLQRICPPLQANVPVKKDQKPSAIPIVSDTSTAIEQQDRDLRGTTPSTSRSTKRRGSSTSAKRRSLEILPDISRPSSRGPSIYHTPSSSVMHPSWMTAKSSVASSTPPAASSSDTFTLKGNGSTDTISGPSEASTVGQPTGNACPGIPSILEPGGDDEDEEYQKRRQEADAGEEQESAESTLPAKEVFGARDGIKHFYTSAKSGENVDEIFTYLAKRIAARWSWQEEEDHLNGFLPLDGEPGNVKMGRANDSIRVGGGGGERKGWRGKCC